ncbi:MAG: hypothetical protein LBV36_07255 [Chromatiales bacterium]|nr:hypothetical protein [Chromatiales bacterium]
MINGTVADVGLRVAQHQPIPIFIERGENFIGARRRGNMSSMDTHSRTPVPISTPIACYVSGKGMHATNATWNFKTLIIATLGASGLGYDTRYRYYEPRFPSMAPAALARLICDPIEYYDSEWPAYWQSHGGDETRAATAFMLERDKLFQREARVAVYCYDEAGFGSGVNSVRFLEAGKPILGFYHEQQRSPTLNLSNILQLELEYPRLFTLRSYRNADDIAPQLTAWLSARAAQAAGPG